jgi:hypothetical protein
MIEVCISATISAMATNCIRIIEMSEIKRCSLSRALLLNTKPWQSGFADPADMSRFEAPNVHYGIPSPAQMLDAPCQFLFKFNNLI